MKNIYKLSQEVNTGWDTYDSMVIIADSEKEAILLSYEETYMLKNTVKYYLNFYIKMEEPFSDYEYIVKKTSSWAFEKDIKIEYLGQADSNITESQVICTSFNAG